MELLLEIFNDPLMQSMIIGPLMGLLFTLLFSGLSSPPPSNQAALQAVGISVTQTQNIYIKTIQSSPSRSGGNDDGIVIIIVVGLALCWIVWKYATMAINIQSWIGTGLITALSFSVFSMVVAWLKGHYTSRDWWLYTLVPLALLLAAAVVFNKAVTVFDPRLTEIALHSNFLDFYTKKLPGYWRTFMLSHVGGLVLLCTVILLAFLALLHNLALMNQRAPGRLRSFWRFITGLTNLCSGFTWLIVAIIGLAGAIVAIYPELLVHWLTSR